MLTLLGITEEEEKKTQSLVLKNTKDFKLLTLDDFHLIKELKQDQNDI